jgi:hypothetical protein
MLSLNSRSKASIEKRAELLPLYKTYNEVFKPLIADIKIQF